MLSILIPLYRYDIRPLIQRLRDECSRLDTAWEIIVLNDASGTDWDTIFEPLRKDEELIWIEAAANLGRAEARNRLAEAAQYPWLLFLDCDGMPEQADFLHQYLHATRHTGADVIVGGRSYARQKPRLPFVLHWTYGSAREVKPASERALAPYRSFMTNNFAIHRQRFESVKFDSSLKEYGHEDTLFGIELESRSYSILHIDNPMRHVGLDADSDFIRKAERALDNLVSLYARGKYLPVKLLDTALHIEAMGLSRLLIFAAAPWMKVWRKSLFCRRPKLYIFDCYRLICCLRKLEASRKLRSGASQ